MLLIQDLFVCYWLFAGLLKVQALLTRSMWELWKVWRSAALHSLPDKFSFYLQILFFLSLFCSISLHLYLLCLTVRKTAALLL